MSLFRRGEWLSGTLGGFASFHAGAVKPHAGSSTLGKAS